MCKYSTYSWFGSECFYDVSYFIWLFSNKISGKNVIIALLFLTNFYRSLVLLNSRLFILKWFRNRTGMKKILSKIRVRDRNEKKWGERGLQTSVVFVYHWYFCICVSFLEYHHSFSASVLAISIGVNHYLCCVFMYLIRGFGFQISSKITCLGMIYHICKRIHESLGPIKTWLLVL